MRVLQGISSLCLLACVWWNCVQICHAVVEEVQFLAGTPTCNDDQIVSHGCAELALSSQSKLQCFDQCRRNSSCVGVSRDIGDQTYCVLHGDCSRDVNCTPPVDPNRRFYSRNCAHGGRWKPEDEKCICVNGWVGASCRELPRDYSDMAAAGYPSGHVRAYLDLRAHSLGLVLVSVVIDTDTDNSSVPIMRNSGNMDFNRSWAEYRDGFHVDDKNFWNGLNHWWALNTLGYTKLSITLQLKDGRHAYRTYNAHSISDASGGFTLSFGGSYTYGSTIRYTLFTDCFGPYTNKPFSTFDAVPGGHGEPGCAAQVGSGWWYTETTCDTPCNIFGRGAWTTSDPAQQLRILYVHSTYLSLDLFDSIQIQVGL